MGGEFSDDTIFNGRVKVRQRREGYRFSLDSLLLAWYASAVPATLAVELGAGNGVISLALAFMRPRLEIVAVEIQESLYQLAAGNIRDNGFERVSALPADLRTLSGPEWEGSRDLVLSNPPFRAVGSGRLNPEPEKARARHELLATLDDIVACAARVLRPGGAAALVLLPERESDLESAALRHRMSILHRLRVKPFAGKEANILLVILRLEMETEYPEGELVVYREVGEYSAEVKAIIDGEWKTIPHPLAGMPELRRKS
jgi:tRNA1Val (adenine37-N6)-methyltransferase